MYGFRMELVCLCNTRMDMYKCRGEWWAQLLHPSLSLGALAGSCIGYMYCKRFRKIEFTKKIECPPSLRVGGCPPNTHRVPSSFSPLFFQVLTSSLPHTSTRQLCWTKEGLAKMGLSTRNWFTTNLTGVTGFTYTVLVFRRFSLFLRTRGWNWK